jgi:oligopeptidase B
LFGLDCLFLQQIQTDMKAPIAKKIPKELTIHGHTRIDNYYWMNDRENPEVIQYLNDENAYTKEQLKGTEGLQEELYNEIVGRIKQDDQSVPYFLEGYSYYSRFEEEKEYPIYCRKKGDTKNTEATSEEEVLLDANVSAATYDYFEVGGISISPDNKLMAYSYDNVSRRLYTIVVKNLETGELLIDKIENTSGGITWASDGQTFFYTQKDIDSLRSYKIFRHSIGGTEDVEIYHEVDDTFSCYVYKTKSKKYLAIGSDSTLSSEHHILLADNPFGEFQLFQKRETKLEYSFEHVEDTFYILTNEKALNFKLVSCSEVATKKENWKELIPHRKDVLLESVELFANYMVLDERSKGLTNLRVIDLKTKEDHYIDFGESAYTAYISVNFDFNSTTLRFGYSSLTTPSSVFDYQMETKEKQLLKQQEIIGGYSPENYQSERIYVKARDGVEVPVSIVYKKGTKLDGKSPLLLYAYGSYGYSIDAQFSSVRLSLLDRGFVYAIAHIRGGEEMGRHWYEEGKLLKKMNTFTDFIDVAKSLIKDKYTSEDKLCAMGGSAGGMLMGGVVNMNPELFKVVIAAVPFVDVVTTMLDDTIPLTTGEYDEWGNPNEKESYDYMLSYSPYDQVGEKTYPSMLITSGLHDSQVQYFEPTKWVAKLREVKQSDSQLLLHTNMEAGHGGASGRFAAQKETALEYAFLITEVS